MQNEVYGTITLQTSQKVTADNEKDGLQEANNKINNLNLQLYNLPLRNEKGQTIEVKIHDFNVKWEEFFGEDK